MGTSSTDTQDVFTVIIPQCSYLVAARSVDLPEDWWQRPWELGNETRRSLASSGLVTREAALASADG